MMLLTSFTHEVIWNISAVHVPPHPFAVHVGNPYAFLILFLYLFVTILVLEIKKCAVGPDQCIWIIIGVLESNPYLLTYASTAGKE